ncbi:hypothetical protein HPB50_029548 [Hyalomma asiaticum]|nr:hypothetical protein HPB50_029548 [Hyalomma asiaticum]
MKHRPISVTIDESPELRGCPAVVVFATFYGAELRGRSCMQKLHEDLRLSSSEFKALHFKDPCCFLTNALSSRELRRKFGLVCVSVEITIKSLRTPLRWLSFYEALKDILDYWRAIFPFYRK